MTLNKAELAMGLFQYRDPVYGYEIIGSRRTICGEKVKSCRNIFGEQLSSRLEWEAEDKWASGQSKINTKPIELMVAE